MEPLSDEPGNRGKMTPTPEHIAAQIEAVHRAGFDMHIHADVRAVPDAIEDIQKRLREQGSPPHHLRFVNNVPRRCRLLQGARRAGQWDPAGGYRLRWITDRPLRKASWQATP
jgi:predicted amidohydrolase YtcJ